jgi:hypothetical protein
MVLRVIFRVFSHAALFATGLYLLLFSTAYIVLQFPAVQNRILPHVNQALSQALKTTVFVGKIDLALFDHIVLEDVFMADFQRQPMFSAQRVAISMIRVPTLAWLREKDLVKRISVRTVSIESGKLNVYIAPKEKLTNLELTFASDTPPDTSAPHRMSLYVGEVDITDLEASYVDSTKSDSTRQPQNKRLNYTNLHFNPIQLQAGFSLDEFGNMVIPVHRLSANEVNSHVNLAHFSSEIESVELTAEDTSSHVFFRDTRINVDSTHLGFDLHMPGETMGTLFSLGRNRKFELDVAPSVVDLNVINHFSPTDVPLRSIVKVSGTVTGDYTKMRTRNLALNFGQSEIRAMAKIDNYTNSDRLLMQVSFDQSRVSSKDLKAVLPTVALPQWADRLGEVQLAGKFTGFWYDFVTNAAMKTDLGGVAAKIHLTYDTLAQDVGYDGFLTTEDFNLDQLLGVQVSNRLNFQGELKGKGTDLKTANVTANFNVVRTSLGGYGLDSVHAALTLAKQQLNGTVTVADNEGNLDGRLTANLAGAVPEYDFVGDFKYLDIGHYTGSSLPLKLSTIVNLKVQGDSLDNISGLGRFLNMEVFHTVSGKRMAVKNFTIRGIDNTKTQKTISINSSLLDLDWTGNFSYDTGVEVGEQLFKEMMLHLRRDTVGLDTFYAHKRSYPTDMSLLVACHRLEPLFDLLNVPLSIAPKTLLDMRIKADSIERVDIELMSPEIGYDSILTRNMEFGWQMAKDVATDSNFNVQTRLLLDNLAIGNAFYVDKCQLTAKMLGYDLDFKLLGRQQEYNNIVDVMGKAHIGYESIAVSMNGDSSRLVLRDETWNILSGNKVTWAPQALGIERLVFKHDNRVIDLKSNVKADGTGSILAKIEHLPLGTILELAEQDTILEGQVEAEVEVFHVFERPVVRLDGRIRDWGYDKVILGDLLIDTKWTDGSPKLALDVDWLKAKDTLIHLTGFYDLEDNKQPLHFTVDAPRLPAPVLAPFLKGVMSDLQGAIELDHLQLRGNLDAIKLTGYGKCDMALKVDALQTHFALNEVLHFKGDQILILGGKLFNYDPEKKRIQRSNFLQIDGRIDIRNIANPYYRFDFSNAKQFVAMNTTKYDNSAFYGQVLIQSGKGSLAGNLDGLTITSEEAVLDRGTVINMQTSTHTRHQRLSYVDLVGFDQDANATPISDFKLEFNLQVRMTPEVLVNIIFDERVGDKISARGNGNFMIKMPPDEDMTMNGEYEIESGDYLFTYMNVINRKFAIDKGSKLSWSGDPFNAMLDLRAIYRVENASLHAWDTTQSNRAKVDVILKMNGPLAQPDIKFDISLPNLNQQSNFHIVNALNLIERNPQELNRQVFSLIVLGSVAPLGQFFGQDATASGVSSSMSEFFSNQLNNLISQRIGENVGISVAYHNRTVVLNLKASLLNNRITIERNGAISSQNGARDVSLGNVSVQFRILPGANSASASGGLLAAEAFNREAIVSNTMSTTTRGAGIFYRQSFDPMEWRRRRSKRKQQQALKPTAIRMPNQEGTKP